MKNKIPPAMKAFVNGCIYTMDASKPNASAILIKGNRIEKIGDSEEILNLGKAGKARIIDLDGQTLIPGFYDSHLHLLSYGFSLEMIDLNNCTSMSQLQDKVSQFIRENKTAPGIWIQGRGWNQEKFSDRQLPTHKDLDSVSSDHPMLFTRTCGQMCVANSLALDLILGQLKDNTITQEGLDCDSSGRPTGLISGNARDLFFKNIPSLGVPRIKQLIQKAGQKYIAAGITSVQTDDFELVQAGSFRDILDSYFELDRANQLPVRVNKMLYLPDEKLLDEFIALGLKTRDGSNFFKIGPYKLSIDGSLGARTAALCSPYADDPGNEGFLTMSGEKVKNLVKKAHRAGLQVAIDGIGDKTMGLILDVYRDVMGKKDTSARPCIDHCQVTSPEIIDRFKRNNVTAGLELVFTATDQEFAEQRLGKNRADKAYAWKSFVDNHVPIAMGSDSPVEDFHPFLGIHAAVTRKAPGIKNAAAWHPEQCLSVYQALFSATMGAARASFEEDLKGSLTPGKLADMVVLDRDPFKTDPDDLYKIKAVQTILNGKTVFGP